ncbi:MAG TPA: hypothetical protein P5044_04585, partial [bacterium]|nr:hypothetical protein [bacterium]
MKKFFVFMLFVSAVFQISAATRTVCAVGCDYTSVKAAVTAAVAGDTVLISAGTYQDYNILVDKDLTIEGAGRNDTIVQAKSSEGYANYRVFNITDGTVTFKNMTIRYGYANTDNGSGGGINFAGTLLIVDNCYIHANGSYSNGGGIQVSDSAAIINKSLILGNKADGDYGGGVSAYNSVVTVTESTISGNSAGYGGGIYVNKAEMNIEKSVISGNTASQYGGGIYNYNVSSTNIRNSTVSNN